GGGGGEGGGTRRSFRGQAGVVARGMGSGVGLLGVADGDSRGRRPQERSLVEVDWYAPHNLAG
ncbi:MAG: hypothetical protein HQL57_09540, partial [Magnetococcales bacterium]|nr:hypothetical protein [Magnetococcales bacterium]